jgi:uncharacterized protein YdaU (DUF1376 family)
MKDPAVLFYTSDFLTGTLTMTDEQVGKYIRLLCLQHQTSFISEIDMNIICKSDEKVMSKFIKTENGFFNQRLKVEIEKRANFCNSRRKNREGKLKEKPTPPKKVKENNICFSYVKHMENENEIINVIENDNKILIKIFIKWLKYKNERKENYKTKISFNQCYNNLLEYSNGNILLAEKIINKSIAGNYQGFFELKEWEKKNNPTKEEEIINKNNPFYND